MNKLRHNLMKIFFNIQKNIAKTQRQSIFDEVDRKISKPNGTSYLFYFTK